LSANLVVADSGQGIRRRHDDQFPVCGKLKRQVRMLGAKLREGFVSHRTDGQDRRQMSVINQKRH
jgi:hypothetical protein